MLDAMHVCRCYDFVVEAVLMGVLCVVGFVGNSVSVVCLHADKSKTPTPLLLIALLGISRPCEVLDVWFLRYACRQTDTQTSPRRRPRCCSSLLSWPTLPFSSPCFYSVF